MRGGGSYNIVYLIIQEYNIMPHLTPPLPVTIVVRNFFPPQVAAASSSSSSLHNTTSTTVSDVTNSSSLIPPSPPVLLHKPTSYIIDERYTLASRRVLRPVRLDIFARRHRRKLDGNDENDDFLLSKEEVVEGVEEEEEEEVLYSSTLMHPSSHPRWDHVDEGLQLDGGSAYLPYYSYSSSSSSSSHVRENDNVQQRQSYDDVELYARFLVLLDDDESTTTTTDESSYNSNVVEKGNDGVSNDCSGGERRRRLRRRQWTTMVKIPLDSTKLCHLPNNMNDSNNDDNNETEEEEDDSFNNAIQIPNTLPLNTILIYYNDGYTRVLPALYYVLLQKHIIYDKIPQKNHVNGSFSSIDHDKLFNSLEEEGDNNNNSSVVANGSATAIVHAVAEDKIIDSTNINGYCSTACDYVRTVSSKVDELPLLPQSIPTSNKTMKIEMLRQLIQIEQQLLNHDEQQRIIEGRNQLRSIMEQVQAMENEIHKSEDATGTERVNLFRNEIRCETNRIHLVMQLRCIFPIRVTHNDSSVIHPPNYPKQQYMIANLPFPDDIHTPIVSDDQISAALGYVCQLVALASKYLDIPLRYTLICKASRSAVLFVSIGEVTSFSSSSRGGMVYPLFRERGVIDREQLDYGLTLLDRNVNCLLRVRNVSYRNDWNLLAKIDRLLVHVIDGE